MNNADYIAGIFKAYQDELAGELFFDALARMEDDPERIGKLQALAQLERETAASMRPLVEKHGGPIEMDYALQRQSVQDAAVYSDKTWEDVMLSMSEVLPSYVKTFSELEAAAPTGELPALQGLTRHEEALVEFVRRELCGQTSDSLAPVLALLSKLPENGTRILG